VSRAAPGLPHPSRHLLEQVGWLVEVVNDVLKDRLDSEPHGGRVTVRIVQRALA
jgi:hypothetical protein